MTSCRSDSFVQQQQRNLVNDLAYVAEVCQALELERLLEVPRDLPKHLW